VKRILNAIWFVWKWFVI